jgi:Tol biopolymer transport system component
MKCSPLYLSAVTFFLAGLAGAPAVQAQYFGQNKVQYEGLDFKTLKTEHFDIHYYDEMRDAAELSGMLAERWYWRLVRILDHELSSRQDLILYASSPHFQQTNAVAGSIGEGTGGVTEAFKRRVVMPLAGPISETDHVLGHELVHAFQFDMTTMRGSGVSAGGGPGVLRLPLWLVEGMAEYLSVGPVDAHTAMWMRDGVQNDRLPNLRDLQNPAFFPYRWGQALWSYVGGRWGDDVVVEILKTASPTGDLRHAFGRVLGVPLDTLIVQWHDALRAAYTPVLESARPASDFARPVITGRGSRGRLNVAPALSPDGTKLAFLSERDLFSIEMFLADVETGKIIRKIVKTAVNPHFESLQFINSAGTWAPDGRQFAFGGVSRGRPVLTIIDTERGKTIKEQRFEELGEIFNPAWSPDGRTIAFTASVGGLSDLYLFDVDTDSLSRLTNDPFAELQPAWTADGRIVVVTDQIGADAMLLRTGNYRLAIIDPKTAAFEALPALGEGKHINPEVARDGSIYFLADPDGVSNIYRFDPATGDVRRMTNIATGVSGITGLSPALSIAYETGAMAFSVFIDGGYDIYVADEAAVTEGMLVAAGALNRDAAILPPRDRLGSRVIAMLDDYESGLPPDSAFVRARYSAKLSLDYVAPPSVAVGADRFGTYVGGGSALFFSDLLGNRQLAAALGVYGTFEDISALVAYSNTSSRWNWGLAGQQVPYVSAGYLQGFDSQGNFIQLTQRFRQTNREVSGLLSFPFNRVRRVDFGLGYRNISYDLEVDSLVVSPFGEILVDRRVNLQAPDALNFAFASAALVYDNTIFGATSPLLGQRYRIEAAPTLGSFEVVTGLVDFRKYVMPVRPFTLAFRALHYGRYGSGSDDPRLQPLFVGYQSLVRGYDIGSFNTRECVASTSFPVGGFPGPTTSNCPVFDQLIGSRIGVLNLEVRFPLLGVLGIGSGYYGFLPIETAVFADAGMAWDSFSKPTIFGGNRQIVTSAGFTMRLNMLGFAIVQIDYVKPFQRPDKGWYFELGFTPGF